MKRANVILLGLPVIAAGFFAYALLNSKNPDQTVRAELTDNAVAPIPQSASIPEVRENNEGGVQVVVQPIGFSDKDATWNFSVAMNTHTGDLGEDLARASGLKDEKGNNYKAIAWEGDPPGGHHRSGVLKFNPMPPGSAEITLIIRDVGGVSERKFNWKPN